MKHLLTLIIALLVATEAIAQPVENKNLQMQILLSKAHTYFEMGEYELSQSTVQNVIDMEPENISAWQLQGDIQRKLRNYQSALTAFDRALSLLINPPNKKPSEASFTPTTRSFELPKAPVESNTNGRSRLW